MEQVPEGQDEARQKLSRWKDNMSKGTETGEQRLGLGTKQFDVMSVLEPLVEG